MTTYTIAYHNALFAIVPDGEDVVAAAADQARAAGTIEDFDSADLAIVDGLTLTDEPEEGDEIVWRAMATDLADLNGRRYKYAVARGTDE